MVVTYIWCDETNGETRDERQNMTGHETRDLLNLLRDSDSACLFWMSRHPNFDWVASQFLQK